MSWSIAWSIALMPVERMSQLCRITGHKSPVASSPNWGTK